MTPEGLRVIAHGPAAWFLLAADDSSLLLAARYSDGAVIDDDAVIELTSEERAQYDAVGTTYLDDLQRRIHDAAPYRPESPWHARDLKRLHGAAVDAAIRDFLAH